LKPWTWSYSFSLATAVRATGWALASRAASMLSGSLQRTGLPSSLRSGSSVADSALCSSFSVTPTVVSTNSTCSGSKRALSTRPTRAPETLRKL
jgi:hypothetical protein